MIGSCILIVVGAIKGASWLSHAGALVTIIGIWMTFVTLRERERFDATEARLLKMLDEKLDIVLASQNAGHRATSEATLRGEVSGEIEMHRREHERGLALAEVFLLSLGTLAWGFADLLTKLIGD